MKKIIAALLVLLMINKGNAQTSFYRSVNGKAINGYDPVAYFLQNSAVAGNDRFSTEWSGATWMFNTQSNLDSFKLDPEKYAPQYGGYCAYGCSENHKSPTDPNAFTIVDNKLYLNYNPKVKELWKKDMAKRIKAADNNWVSLNKN